LQLVAKARHVERKNYEKKNFAGLADCGCGSVSDYLGSYPTCSTAVDIMSGTQLIANIIQDVAGDKMETRTLVPSGNCPGHYDVKPRDIRAFD
jgi:ABC-type Zn uptake system ZnuABC Zn-binding protein ZnuA